MDETLSNDSDFFEQLAHMQLLLHRYRLQKHQLLGPMSDPHRGQGRVLTLLTSHPEISQKELGYLLNMRPQSLGELLTKLERAGYITRSPAETDRRVLNIKLTEEGHQAADANNQAAYSGILDCLNDEEQHRFIEYLSRVINSLEMHINEIHSFNFGYNHHQQPPHKHINDKTESSTECRHLGP